MCNGESCELGCMELDRTVLVESARLSNMELGLSADVRFEGGEAVTSLYIGLTSKLCPLECWNCCFCLLGGDDGYVCAGAWGSGRRDRRTLWKGSSEFGVLKPLPELPGRTSVAGDMPLASLSPRLCAGC